jgi:hypothetical protein
MSKPSEKRVVMAREVAGRWLGNKSTPEYRISIYEAGTSRPIRNLASLLRSFRDGKAPIRGIPTIEDLGVESPDGDDTITIWSSDHAGLIGLDTWLAKRGYETTGIW